MTSVRARLPSFLRDPRGRAHLQPSEFPDIMVNPSSLLARTNNLLSVSSGKISSSVFRLMRISRLQRGENVSYAITEPSNSVCRCERLVCDKLVNAFQILHAS